MFFCNALLVGLIGLPVDVALMMLFDQHLPLIAWQMLDPLAPGACWLERHRRSRLAIDVGTETEHEPDAGERNLGRETREAGSCNRTGAREAEVLVDDENAILGPAEVASLAGKRILPIGCRSAG